MKQNSRSVAILVASLMLSFGVAAQAQPPGGGPGGRPGGPGGFGGLGLADQGSLGLLLRPEVRSELELLDHQVEQLTALGEGLRGQLRQLMTPDQNLSPQERMQRFQEIAEKTRVDMDEKVKQILLPHQQKRLDQLNNQMRMRGGGGMLRALASQQFAEELGLTEAQREKVRAKAEQLEAEMRQKMTELRSQAQEELLKELTPAQQAQLKERFGEPFEFQGGMPQFGAGGPGGPGPGGFGPGSAGPGGARPGAAAGTGEEGRGRRGSRPQQ
jgi:Spy/CpxP family protein refolding chaperone